MMLKEKGSTRGLAPHLQPGYICLKEEGERGTPSLQGKPLRRVARLVRNSEACVFTLSDRGTPRYPACFWLWSYTQSLRQTDAPLHKQGLEDKLPCVCVYPKKKEIQVALMPPAPTLSASHLPSASLHMLPLSSPGLDGYL